MIFKTIIKQFWLWKRSTVFFTIQLSHLFVQQGLLLPRHDWERFPRLSSHVSNQSCEFNLCKKWDITSNIRE